MIIELTDFKAHGTITLNVRYSESLRKIAVEQSSNSAADSFVPAATGEYFVDIDRTSPATQEAKVEAAAVSVLLPALDRLFQILTP